MVSLNNFDLTTNKLICVHVHSYMDSIVIQRYNKKIMFHLVPKKQTCLVPIVTNMVNIHEEMIFCTFTIKV